jgi:hypothetical protein
VGAEVHRGMDDTDDNYAIFKQPVDNSEVLEDQFAVCGVANLGYGAAKPREGPCALDRIHDPFDKLCNIIW